MPTDDVRRLEERIRAVEMEFAALKEVMTSVKDIVANLDRDHTGCVARCSQNREGIYNRIGKLEVNQAVNFAKVSAVWGLLGVLGGSVVVAIVTKVLGL